MALPLYKMLQPCVDHFFDSMKFGSPGFLGIVESLVDGIEARIDMRAQIAEGRVVNENSHEYGDRRNSNGKGDLNGLIGHRCHQNTLFKGILAQ